MVGSLIPMRWYSPPVVQTTNNVGFGEMAAAYTATQAASGEFARAVEMTPVVYEEGFHQGIFAYEQAAQSVVERPLTTIGMVAATLLGMFVLMTAQRVVIDNSSFSCALRETIETFKFWKW